MTFHLPLLESSGRIASSPAAKSGFCSHWNAEFLAKESFPDDRFQMSQDNAKSPREAFEHIRIHGMNRSGQTTLADEEIFGSRCLQYP